VKVFGTISRAERGRGRVSFENIIYISNMEIFATINVFDKSFWTH
jgi:hypothetical protein